MAERGGVTAEGCRGFLPLLFINCFRVMMMSILMNKMMMIIIIIMMIENIMMRKNTAKRTNRSNQGCCRGFLPLLFLYCFRIIMVMMMVMMVRMM